MTTPTLTVVPPNGAAGQPAVPQPAQPAQAPNAMGAGVPPEVQRQYNQAQAWLAQSRAQPGTPAAQAVQQQVAGLQVSPDVYAHLQQTDPYAAVPGSSLPPTPQTPAQPAAQPAAPLPPFTVPAAAPAAPAPAGPDPRDLEIARMAEQQERLVGAVETMTKHAAQPPAAPAAPAWDANLSEDFDDATRQAIKSAVESVQSQADQRAQGLEAQVKQLGTNLAQATEALNQSRLASYQSQLNQVAHGLRSTVPGFDVVNDNDDFARWLQTSRDPMSGQSYRMLLDAAVDAGDVARASRIYQSWPHYAQAAAYAAQAAQAGGVPAQAAVVPVGQSAPAQPVQAAQPAPLTAQAVMDAAAAAPPAQAGQVVPALPAQAPMAPPAPAPAQQWVQPVPGQLPVAPQVPYQAAAPAQTPMDALMVPQVAAPLPQAQAQQAGGLTWTKASIDEFKARMARGSISGAQADQLIADLRRAPQEGRIVG